MPTKKSAYIIFYYDIDFLEHILDHTKNYFDEIILVDGPYEYCINNLKKLNLYYDQESMPDIIKNIILKFNLKYHYKIWKNEKEKRMFGYEMCTNDIVMLLDCDEFYVIDYNNTENFIDNPNYHVAGFNIYNMNRHNTYFSYSHKNIMFKKKYISSHQHLSYTWLVGVDNLEEQNNNIIFPQKIGLIYHQTLNRKINGNIIKYIFYISLYNINNNLTNNLILNYDINYLLEHLTIEEIKNIFIHSKLELINMPNINHEYQKYIEEQSINLSRYNYNHIHGYFKSFEKILTNMDFYYYLNFNDIYVNNENINIIMTTENIKNIDIEIYEIYINKKSYINKNIFIEKKNDLFYIHFKLNNIDISDVIIKIKCISENGDFCKINNIFKNFKFINFNTIIPLGEECYTCQALDKKFNSEIRKEGLPFDYVGHTFIDNIRNFINNNFTNKFIINKNMYELIKFDDKNEYFYKDVKYGFMYWHDKIDNFIDKYQNRYNKLYDKLNSKNIILILSVQHFDNIYNNINRSDNVKLLFDDLKNINKNIYLLCINYCTWTFNYDNFLHIYIPVNRNLEFHKSKEEFTYKLYDIINTLFV